MGLDQWIYKIGRVEDQIAKAANGMKEDDIAKNLGSDISVWKASKTADHLLTPIASLLQKVEVIYSEYDMEKIYAELGIDDSWYMGRWSNVGHGIDMRFYPGEGSDGEDPKDFHIDECDEPNYTINVPHDAYLVRTEEVSYYRKEYDLQEDMYELCDYTIENCGYYPLNAEMKAALRKHDKKIRLPRCKKSEMLVYHEWY